MSMPKLKAKNKRHYVFTVKRNGAVVKSHTLIVNPEDLLQDEPARTEVFKTFGGSYAEEWGRDIISYTIRGTTGYRIRKNAQGKSQSGAEAFKALRDDIFRYYLEPEGVPKQLQTDTSVYTLEFNNFDDGEHYVILPTRFNLKRSKSQPLLYMYDFSFACLRTIVSKTPTTSTSNVRTVQTLSTIKNVILSTANIIRIMLR